MILKSFEIENDISKISRFSAVLIYGENIGLKDTLKSKIIEAYQKAEIIKIFQEDIIKNKEIIKDEILNVSLFSEQKIIIINQVTDKNIKDVEYFLEHYKKEIKITLILIGDQLDKKSKIRSLFENKSNLGIIPCYSDTSISLKILIQKELKNFKNLDNKFINLIINYSNSNRTTILDNIIKIKLFFNNKIISEHDLEKLLSTDRNEIFENIRDAALSGEKIKLNELMGNYVFNNDETFSYLNAINYRLLKLLDIHQQISIYGNQELAISKVRPPIFWKDKPILLKLIKKWDKIRVLGAIKYVSKTEETIKKNSQINNIALVKNSILNLCSNSWTYF